MITIAAREFYGVAESASAARRFVADQVDDPRVAQVAVVCVNELVCNAIQHSRSGLPGGMFTVSTEVAPAWLRVDVSDRGGAGTPIVRQLSADSIGGRGLSIVGALASEWGVASHRDGLRVWLRFDGPPARRTQAEKPLPCNELAVPVSAAGQ
jgi:serine/threonine-protein kinase RsbW